MKLSERLDKDTKKKLNSLTDYNNKPNKHKKKNRNAERFSEKDLRELMGVNRDRYERRGGSVRRK